MGRPVRSQVGNGLVTTYTYDKLTRRLTRALTVGEAHPSLQDFTYTYDPLGNVTTVDDAAQQAVFFDNAVVTARRDFTYDALSQLVRATGRELAALAQPDNTDAPVRPLPHPNDTAAVRRYTEDYTYDDLGNLMTVAHRAGANGWTRRHRYTYQTDPADRTNRLDATSLPGDPDGVFSATYHHDGLGNIDATPQIAALHWDLLNRLAGADLGGGGSAFYSYDVSGARARKVIDRGAGLVIETLYLGAVEIVRRRRNGQIVSERRVLHISGDDGRLARFDRVTAAENPGPLPAPTLRYVHGDRLGSATLLTDEAGHAVCHEEFHPFGTTAYRSAAPSEDVSLSRYRFCDRERDDETGFYLMGLRYYAPWLGRWLSADPVGYADGFNLYRYSHNNPSTLCDPSGMQAKTKQTHAEAIVPFTVKTEAQFRAWAEGAGIWYVGKPRHDQEGWHVEQFGRYPSGEGGGRPKGGPVARPPGDEPPVEGNAGGKGGEGDTGEGDTAEGKGGEGSGNAKTPSDTGGAEGEQGTGPGAGDKGTGPGGGGTQTAPAIPQPGTSPENAPNAGPGGGGQNGEGAGQGGGAAAQAAPAAEKFIWNYDFPGTGLANTQRGRILEWLAGVPWRDNTANGDRVTATAVQQIKSTSAYDTIGDFTRAATRDAQAYIAANPTTTTGLRPQAVIITPTDAPAQAGTDIANALNPGRGRRIPTGALPPENVRGLPGPVGAVGTGLTVGGTALAGAAFAYDIYRGDAPMAIGDGLSTAGGGLELYAIASPGATVAGVSAMSTGLVAGGAGIAIASGVSAYRAYQRGDTAGVVAGLVGVAAGLAIMAGVIFGAPLLLLGGLIAAVGVGLFHLARWLF
jgi:RHS repeat-associated protein